MFLEEINACGIAADKLPFDFFGLCLQEPMALITNWLIATTAFILFFRLKAVNNLFQKHWKYFYLAFGLSTFFGGLGHLFFFYFGIPGKFPCWFFGILAAYHAGKAMISNPLLSAELKSRLTFALLIKAIVFGSLAMLAQNFLFIMIDAVITYLFFCLGFGAYFWRKGMNGFKYTVLAVIVLIPSIFIFTLQINPHLWFNKEDFSHVLMVTTIILFYLGITNFKDIDLNQVTIPVKKNNK